MSARSYVLNKRRQGNITVSNLGYGFDVKLHQTIVVKARIGVVTLNSGSWKTPTTRTAMNRFFELAGLPYSIGQKKGEWYVHCGGSSLPFTDNMELRT